jgi:NAD(P)-dependent dehydrogenase (short-subunit alcohol dehydrogenase family)
MNKYPEFFSLKNKTAIVTGALGLLGKEHCYALAEAGANVIVTDINEERCLDFALNLPVDSVAVSCDITNPESVNNLLNQTNKVFGSVDILINNAAINDMIENPTQKLEDSKFENYPLDLFRKVLDVNVTGMFLCSQIIGSDMVKQRKGSIINIASTYGIVAPNQSLYTNEKDEQIFYKSAAYPTAKGAVISFTKFLAAYWGNTGIRVNTLSPGGVENNQEQHFINKYTERTPLGRMAKVSDYKGAIIFLASDASSYMTGANLVVDGGWTIW